MVEFFWFVHRRRGVGFSIPPPLTIEAVWFAQYLRRQFLSPWEVDCLFSLDDVYRDFARERADPNYRETPPMIPATASNIKKIFSMLAARPGKQKREGK